MPYAGLINVCVEALDDIVLDVRNVPVVPDEYRQPLTEVQSINVEGTALQIMRTHAFSLYRDNEVSASSAFVLPKNSGASVLTSQNSAEIYRHMSEGETFSFCLIGSICTDRDFIDPCNESNRQVIYGVYNGISRLVSAHEAQWNEMWKSDVIIDGDDEAQTSVRLALYNLYSSVRANSRLSIPPFGLSSQGYNGHIFWDAEIWMYPPLLFLNQGMAKSMIDYRFDRLAAARKKAEANGYMGVMFPWESDDAGEEAFEDRHESDAARIDYARLFEYGKKLRRHGEGALALFNDFREELIELHLFICDFDGIFAHHADDRQDGTLFRDGDGAVSDRRTVRHRLGKGAGIEISALADHLTDASENL